MALRPHWFCSRCSLGVAKTAFSHQSDLYPRWGWLMSDYFSILSLNVFSHSDRMPILCAHLYRTGSRAAAAPATRFTARLRSGRLSQCKRFGPSHSTDIATTHRAAGIAVATARQHSSLLLSFVQVDTDIVLSLQLSRMHLTRTNA